MKLKAEDLNIGMTVVTNAGPRKLESLMSETVEVKPWGVCMRRAFRTGKRSSASFYTGTGKEYEVITND